METYSLFDLNEYLKRVIALNFPEPIWISCEISSCKQTRGNYYLDLIQQNENNEVIAQSSGIIWFKSIYFLKAKLGDLLPSLLKEGVQIKLKVNIEFNERYGMKLVIEDIDPSFTLGQMELNRQKILERLKKEEVTELNKAIPKPKVLQRLAVISSETAAGYIDFKTHLANNAYGYKFTVDLYTAAMQGANTDAEVVNAFALIKENINKYDVVILIRGGGSKLDLSAFDSFNIGYTIACFPIPVITGIGHEIDQSIADMMAHTAMKTPTAVADFIIENNMNYEGKIIEFANVLGSLSNMQVKHNQINMESLFTFIQTSSSEKLKYEKLNMDQKWNEFTFLNSTMMKENFTFLNSIEASLKLSSPDFILKKGFAIVKNGEQFISSKEQMLLHEETTLDFFDGRVLVEVKKDQ
jgi:exodeoxyribonuclease VII large subunit